MNVSSFEFNFVDFEFVTLSQYTAKTRFAWYLFRGNSSSAKFKAFTIEEAVQAAKLDKKKEKKKNLYNILSNGTQSAYFAPITNIPESSQFVSLQKKPLSTMLATSKYVLFPGHNHLLTTGTDDLIL